MRKKPQKKIQKLETDEFWWERKEEHHYAAG